MLTEQWKSMGASALGKVSPVSQIICVVDDLHEAIVLRAKKLSVVQFFALPHLCFTGGIGAELRFEAKTTPVRQSAGS